HRLGQRAHARPACRADRVRAAHRDPVERHPHRRDRPGLRGLGPGGGERHVAHLYRLDHVRRRHHAARAGAAPVAEADGVAAHDRARGGDDMTTMMARAGIALGLLVGAAALTQRTRATVAIDREEPSALPIAVGEWHGQDAGALDAESVRILAADAYVNRTY